jgi:hypothetical protein
MSPANSLLRDETFLEEHRRIHVRLVRLQRFAAPDSGFPSAVSALVACMSEIEALLPDLVEHFSREERQVRGLTGPSRPSEAVSQAEQILSEHVPLLRELRALLESGQRVIEELRAGQNAGSMAEALKIYLTACVADLIEHEEKERSLLSPSAETGQK